jgi:uncharacterized protein (TIGR02246 family)
MKDSAAMAASDPTVVRQAIEAANARFLDAMKSGDTVAMTANYADDAVVMPPGAPAARGRSELMHGFGEMVASGSITDMKATTNDVMVAGDLAVETGSYEFTMVPKKGKPVTDKGKYLTVWKRQPDGNWKIVRDIDNSDMPPKT